MLTWCEQFQLTVCCAMLCCPVLQVVHEPVDRWQRVPSSGGSTLNLLEKFYDDPQKYAYMFQNYVSLTRVQQVGKAARMQQARPPAWSLRLVSALTSRLFVCPLLLKESWVLPVLYYAGSKGGRAQHCAYLLTYPLLNHPQPLFGAGA